MTDPFQPADPLDTGFAEQPPHAASKTQVLGHMSELARFLEPPWIAPPGRYLGEGHLSAQLLAAVDDRVDETAGDVVLDAMSRAMASRSGWTAQREELMRAGAEIVNWIVAGDREFLARRRRRDR